MSSVESILKRMNQELPGIMELELQGHYKRGLFTPKEKGGAKKRYALLDDRNRLVVRGLEAVRRDWCDYSKDLQREVLIEILKNDDKEAAIKKVESAIDSLKKGKVDIRKLILRTQMTKPLEDYSTTAPHLVAAKKMLAKGQKVDVGEIISHFITKGEGSISERAEPYGNVKIKDIDLDYYINNQILPPVIRVLSAIGIGEDELGKEHQKTLKKHLK